MKIYLVDGTMKHLETGVRAIRNYGLRGKILLSYWYFKGLDLGRALRACFDKPYPEIFVDSGGFTADSLGVTITPQEYAAWVKQWGRFFETYINLDVIGDQKGTSVNQVRMEQLGTKPVPILTLSRTGADYDELKRMVEEYNYVCLGGLVPYMGRMKKIMPHLIRCFQIAQGKAVLHGLGVTTWGILKALPWYSVDSSSWAQGYRYGTVPVFDNAQGRFSRFDIGDRKSVYAHGELIERYGFDPLDFASRERFHHSKACGLAAVSYAVAEQWLTRYWRKASE